MRAALANLTAQLDAFTSGRSGIINGASFAPNTTYSSIGLRSIHDDGLIFEHHHLPTGSRNAQLNSTTTLDGDSVYRIASISKVFTVLLVLQQHGTVSLDDPVTQYLPELAAAAAANESVETVDWGSVTLGALASHLAGIGRTCETFRHRRLRIEGI
jgi:CubicO group peptidase (beta-lactamase class C family)